MFWREIALAAPSGLFYLYQFLNSNFDLLNTANREAFAVRMENAITPEIYRAMWVVGANFVVYIVMLYIGIFIVSQFTLPISQWDERKKANKYLWLFLLGLHGPAIFVKGGKKIARGNEIEKKGVGVALVDLSSAIVLERQADALPRQVGQWSNNLIQKGRTQKESKKHLFIRRENAPPLPFSEVAGAGVVFIEKKQKIFETFDLRTQFRKQTNVKAYTPDGIEIQTGVSVTFSLSREPETINIAYISKKNKENIREIKIFDDKENDNFIFEKIKEIDLDDAEEVYHNVKDIFSFAHSVEKKQGNALYPFSKERIQGAAYSIAQNVKDDTTIPWSDLPVQIATEIFIRMLSYQSYDYLYDFDDAKNFPLEDEFKEEFARKVKHKGLLKYQFIRRKDGQPFSNNIGQHWNKKLIEISPVQDFKTVKALRARGITIVSAGFDDLQPTNPGIRKKILEKWKARWEREIQLIKAKHELEAMRVHNKTRAQMQREMTYLLSNIFQSDPHSEEALALRVFQALEMAATNPGVDIPSKEILAMLQTLHTWLLKERKETIKKISASNKTQPTLDIKG